MTAPHVEQTKKVKEEVVYPEVLVGNSKLQATSGIGQEESGVASRAEPGEQKEEATSLQEKNEQEMEKGEEEMASSLVTVSELNMDHSGSETQGSLPSTQVQKRPA